MKLAQLPRGWKITELDDLRAEGQSTFVGGPFGSDLTQSDYVDDPGVPVIRGVNLGGSESLFIDEGFGYVSEAKAAALSRNLAYPGDLIFTQRGTLGQVAVIPERARFSRYVISQSQMKMTPDPSKIDSRFLYRYLRAPQTLSRLLSNTQTTGVPHINLGILKRFPVAVPPLPEQRRIADVLDRAEALRAKRQAALAQLATLTQAIFLDMFGEPATNPKDWPIVPLAEYVSEFAGGRSFESDRDEQQPARYRILKVSAVTGMKYVPSESKPVPDHYDPPLNHFVREGDLLLSRANTPQLVGAVAYVDQTPANILLPDKLWRFVWRAPRLAEPLFVWALFQTRSVRYELGRRATGTSGSMKNISQEKLLSMQTILPPLDVQRHFAQRLAAVERLQRAYTRSLAEFDALFASLQHRAFRGEL